MIYNPFKITKQLFHKNIKGQVKVWIHSNVYSNRPLFPVNNQMETVHSFISTLEETNYEIAQFVRDCRTLRDIIQKLKSSNQRKKGHKYTPSISMKIVSENANNCNLQKSLFENCGYLSPPISIACSPRAKSSSPNFKNIDTMHKKQGSCYFNKSINRPQSNISPILIKST